MDRSYGWHKDKHDHRDRLYSAHRPTEFGLDAPLPKSVDLRKYMPHVWDQGSLGACTAHAIAACVAYLRIKDQSLPDWSPSRLFIYYGEREMEGTIDEDAGAQIRDGIKYLAQAGAPPEDLWPYEKAKFASRPDESVYMEAVKHKTVEYMKVNWHDLDEVKACLAAGFPIAFGFLVYRDFESQNCAKTGILHMPRPGENEMGGHAVCAVGYDDSMKSVLVRNSWGQGWGRMGHFWMPYDYITSPTLSDDFWTIRATL